jgi:hypothetical protein
VPSTVHRNPCSVLRRVGFCLLTSILCPLPRFLLPPSSLPFPLLQTANWSLAA